MSGLTSISFVDDLGSTPATVNRRTGELFLSAKKWKTMTPDQRLFMILHEEGHVVLNTTNEFEADNYAFEQYIKTGSSLKSSVSALTDVLSNDNPEHIARAMQQFKRAKNFDQKKNNKMNPSFNHTAAKSLSIPQEDIFVDFGGRRRRKRNPANTQIANLTRNSHSAAANRIGGSVMNAISQRHTKHANRRGGQVMESIVDTIELESFGGRAKKRQEARQARKMVKAESKAYKREAKGDKKRLNGEANLELAKLGINARGDMAKGILGGMAKVAGAVGGSIVGAQGIKALAGGLTGKGGGDSNEDQVAGNLAPQGGNLGNVLQQAAPFFQGALGAKINEQDPYENTVAGNYNNARIAPIAAPAPIVDISPEEKKKDNTMLFVGIGGAVVVVVLLLVFLKK